MGVPEDDDDDASRLESAISSLWKRTVGASTTSSENEAVNAANLIGAIGQELTELRSLTAHSSRSSRSTLAELGNSSSSGGPIHVSERVQEPRRGKKKRLEIREFLANPRQTTLKKKGAG